jgi:hypothetical protein
MLTLLSDPSPTVYFVLIGVVLVTGVIAARKQDRRSWIVLGAAAGVLLLVFLIDRSFESPREGAVAAVQEMVQAADGRNPHAFAEHIADTFEYKGAGTPVRVTRDQIRDGGFWDILRRHNVHVAAWDFAREDVREIDPNTVEIGFLGKGEAEGKQFPMYFRATFTRQPDGRMRLTGLASYDPMKRTNEPKSIPFFP